MSDKEVIKVLIKSAFIFLIGFVILTYMTSMFYINFKIGLFSIIYMLLLVACCLYFIYKIIEGSEE